MKRIQLFEFEDFGWFPDTLRVLMTRYINTMHRILKSSEDLQEIILKLKKKAKFNTVSDLCSGSGGPLPEVIKEMNKMGADLTLTLSDLYPNLKLAEQINNEENDVHYINTPVDATNPEEQIEGLRTMICSMHHFNPDQVKAILQSASKAKKPFLAFEISDNSIPSLLAWLAFPFNILSVIFITPFVRPFTWQQFVFTYLIPVLPFLIAWDGAVSNLRTYTEKDMGQIIDDIQTVGYKWKMGKISKKGPAKLYLMGWQEQ